MGTDKAAQRVEDSDNGSERAHERSRCCNRSEQVQSLPQLFVDGVCLDSCCSLSNIYGPLDRDARASAEERAESAGEYRCDVASPSGPV